MSVYDMEPHNTINHQATLFILTWQLGIGFFNLITFINVVNTNNFFHAKRKKENN